MAPEQNQPERPECQNSSINGRLGSVHKFSASLPFRWDNSEIRFTLLSAKIMKDFETGKRMNSRCNLATLGALSIF